VLHDVRWPGRRRANIDHIAIGPAGILVVDAKNWSGAVTTHRGRLRQNGHPRDKELEGVLRAGVDVAALLPPASVPRVLPVLCLAGLTRNSRDFERLAPHLQRERRVLAADLRGRGRSARDPNWRNYQPGVYLADLAALLDDARVARLAIVGTSLGGLLAMMLGAREPKRIAGIVLNDIGPEIDPIGRARIATYVGRSPPVRNWAFDPRFQDPANLPPGTPVVGSVVQTAYRPVYE